MPQDSERVVFASRSQDGSLGVICAITNHGRLCPYYCYSLTRGPLSIISNVQQAQHEVEVDGITAVATVRTIQVGHAQNWHTKEPLSFALLSFDMLSPYMTPGTLCVGGDFRYIVYQRINWGGPLEAACVWYLKDSVFYPQHVKTREPVQRGEDQVSWMVPGWDSIAEAIGVVGAAPEGHFSQLVDPSTEVQPLLWLGSATKIEAVVAINKDQEQKSQWRYRIYAERWTGLVSSKLGQYSMTARFYVQDGKLRFKVQGCSYTTQSAGQTRYQDAEEQLMQLPEQLSVQAALTVLVSYGRIKDVQQAVSAYRAALFNNRYTDGGLSVADGDLWVSGAIQLDIYMNNGSIRPLLKNPTFYIKLTDGSQNVLTNIQITPL